LIFRSSIHLDSIPYTFIISQVVYAWPDTGIAMMCAVPLSWKAAFTSRGMPLSTSSRMPANKEGTQSNLYHFLSLFANKQLDEL